jgi:hypothetical protein
VPSRTYNFDTPHLAAPSWHACESKHTNVANMKTCTCNNTRSHTQHTALSPPRLLQTRKSLQCSLPLLKDHQHANQQHAPSSPAGNKRNQSAALPPSSTTTYSHHPACTPSARTKLSDKRQALPCPHHPPRQTLPPPSMHTLRSIY